MKQRVLFIFGTRPEAVKLCPLVSALRLSKFSQQLDPVVCVTGQHREMLHQVLQVFDIQPDYDLGLMQANQSLPELTSRLIAALPRIFLETKPSLSVVQGDTTTTFCGALSSFYCAVPVAHVEAGLRTFDRSSPFPEEANRVLTSQLTDLHFAATESSAANLLREGIPREQVEVTGNTGIDSVLAVAGRLANGQLTGLQLPIDDRKKLIVVTAHRRESFGAGFESICRALSQLADRDDVQIIWPVHRNPQVLDTVYRFLRQKKNVVLIDPLDYISFVDLMRRAYLLLTDSGGVQEEGPSLAKPILVLREKTERPEAVAAGTVKIVGTNSDNIIRHTIRLLEDETEYQRMARLHNPYGDGHACPRVVQRIASFLKAA